MCFRRERERLFEEKMLYYIARISHSGTPTIRPQKYIRKIRRRKMGWFIAAAAAALSPPYRDEKPNNNNTGQKGHQHREEKKQNKSQWIGKNFQFFYITRNFFVFAINPSNFSSPYIYINKRITRSKRVYFMYRRLNLEREIPTLESNKIDNFFGSQYKLLSHCQHQQIFFLF